MSTEIKESVGNTTPMESIQRLSPAGTALAILAGMADGLALAAILGSQPTWMRGIPWWSWHIAAVVLSLAGFSLLFKNELKLNRWIQAILILGFTIPAPLAGWIVLVCLRAFFRIPRSDRGENRYVLGERLMVTSVRVAAASARQHRSVLDVLNSRDDSLRRKAILALRAVDQRRALPVLQKAIQDGDDQVRLLAQTQYNKILAGIELSVKSLEAEIQKSEPTVVRLLQLAEQYHELVFLGLSSEETQVIYLGRAIELLEQAVAKQPDHSGCRLLLLKCFVRSRKLDAAELQLEELRRRGMREAILMPWEADILFQRRKWSALRECLLIMRQDTSGDSRLGSPMDFWLGEEGLGSPVTVASR